jgi:outer membrane protein assembly factor BamB
VIRNNLAGLLLAGVAMAGCGGDGAINNSASGYNASISPLVTSNGRFFASGNKKLTAYQESDGTEIWSYDYASVNPAAVDGGVVYMAAGQQQSTYMLAFDATNGSLRMKSPKRPSMRRRS